MLPLGDVSPPALHTVQLPLQQTRARQGRAVSTAGVGVMVRQPLGHWITCSSQRSMHSCPRCHPPTLPTWCRLRFGTCCRCTGCTGHCQAATASSWWLLSPGGTPHTLSCLKTRGSEATYCGCVVQKVAQQGSSCGVQRRASNLWSTRPGQRHWARTHLCAGRIGGRCTARTAPGCWRGVCGFPHPRRRPRPCHRAQSRLDRTVLCCGSSPFSLQQGGRNELGVWSAFLLFCSFKRQLTAH